MDFHRTGQPGSAVAVFLYSAVPTATLPYLQRRRVARPHLWVLMAGPGEDIKMPLAAKAKKDSPQGY